VKARNGTKLYWWAKTTAVGFGPQGVMSDDRLARFKTRFDPKNQKKRPSDQEIHEICCVVMQHAETFGDCSKAAVLINSLPVSSKRAKIAHWFLIYSPILVAVKNREYRARIAREGSTAHKPFDIETAEQNPFFLLKP
jgi:hypothetical protein